MDLSKIGLDHLGDTDSLHQIIIQLARSVTQLQTDVEFMKKQNSCKCIPQPNKESLSVKNESSNQSQDIIIENKEIINQSDENKEIIDQSDENKETINQSDENKKTINQTDETKEVVRQSIEQKELRNQSYSQACYNKESTNVKIVSENFGNNENTSDFASAKQSQQQNRLDPTQLKAIQSHGENGLDPTQLKPIQQQIMEMQQSFTRQFEIFEEKLNDSSKIKTKKNKENTCSSDSSNIEKEKEYIFEESEEIGDSSENPAKNVNIRTDVDGEEKDDIPSTIYQYKISEPILQDSIEWSLRKRNPTVTEILFHSGTFYAGKPGYRVQLRAQIDRLHGDIYFSVRVFQGLFDDYMSWPFKQKFCIKLSSKMKIKDREDWILPSKEGDWKRKLGKESRKKKVNLTEAIGPFNITKFLDSKKLVFDISLV